MQRWALLISACLIATTAYATDLLAVYRQALRSDPQILEAEANRQAALEAKPQALSALLPHVTANGSLTREVDTGSSNQTESVTVPGMGSFDESFPFAGRTTTNTHVYGAELRQNLFNWDNWVALKRADAQVAQAQADYEAAQQDLIVRVSQRYFAVLAAQDEVDAQQSGLDSANRQLEQVETRFSVGMIAITDVQEARASHDASAAAVIEAKRQLASAEEDLREITGELLDPLARPKEPFDLAVPDPIGEDTWVSVALQQNLSLLSSRLAGDIAQQNVDSARAGHLPRLDLTLGDNRNKVHAASIYTDGSPYGSQDINQSRRTLGLQLTFPIYSGGMVSSQVRQAAYLHRAAQERIERVTRQTERDTRDAYRGILSEISHVKALQRAVESSATALEAAQAGYEAGTRTSIDVLESRRLWIQARSNFSHSRYDYLLNVIRLQQSAGTLSEFSIGRVNGWLEDSRAR